MVKQYLPQRTQRSQRKLIRAMDKNAISPFVFSAFFAVKLSEDLYLALGHRLREVLDHQVPVITDRNIFAN